MYFKYLLPVDQVVFCLIFYHVLHGSFSAADRASQSIASGLSESGQVSSTITSPVTNAANQVYVSHNHPVAPQHPGAPLLVSNIAQDYRITGSKWFLMYSIYHISIHIHVFAVQVHLPSECNDMSN